MVLVIHIPGITRVPEAVFLLSILTRLDFSRDQIHIICIRIPLAATLPTSLIPTALSTFPPLTGRGETARTVEGHDAAGGQSSAMMDSRCEWVNAGDVDCG